MVSGAGSTSLAPVSPDAIAAALDVLHHAALAIAIPPPPRPDLDSAEKPDLRAYILNLEAQIERLEQRETRSDKEIGRLRYGNHALRQQLAAKGEK